LKERKCQKPTKKTDASKNGNRSIPFTIRGEKKKKPKQRRTRNFSVTEAKQEPGGTNNRTRPGQNIGHLFELKVSSGKEKKKKNYVIENRGKKPRSTDVKGPQMAHKCRKKRFSRPQKRVSQERGVTQ